MNSVGTMLSVGGSQVGEVLGARVAEDGLQFDLRVDDASRARLAEDFERAIYGNEEEDMRLDYPAISDHLRRASDVVHVLASGGRKPLFASSSVQRFTGRIVAVSWPEGNFSRVPLTVVVRVGRVK